MSRTHPCCTCGSPPVVDVSDAWLGCGDESAKEVLRSSLAHWGWCHISIDSSKLPCTFTKSDFVKFFEKAELEGLQSSGKVIYRGRSAESGSSSSEQAEPKQSLEVQRCSRTFGGTSSTPLHKYMSVMHSIAVTITKLLSLPGNTLLQEGPCDSGCCQNGKCTIDLLRIFLYDPVYPALGSSAHTDWGSWTIVWQDAAGGLQTYCPAHDRYVDVVRPQPLERDNEVYFVVHVGDVTSLALGHARQKGMATTVSFPSPKHRVVCPADEPRVSLVYFAYPPPSTSLAEIERVLENHELPTDSKVCYDSYYLLQNQTPGGQVENPESVYRRIRTQHVDEVFLAKWRQVQRGLN